MNEWSVVSVLIAIVGLFATVGMPVIRLNSSIVRLNCSVEILTEHQKEQDAAIKGQAEKASEAHSKIWSHEEEQDRQLNDHEVRIKGLEAKK